MPAPSQGRIDDASGIVDPGMSRLWHVLFTAGVGATTALAVTYGDPGWRWAPIPLMGVLLALHFTVGRRILRDQDNLYGSRTAVLFVYGVTACYMPVVVVSPSAAVGLFVVSPLVYMTGGVTSGTAAVSAVLVVPELVRAGLGLTDWSSLPLQLAVYVLVIGFAHWFGTWLFRVVTQSEERATLIAELQRSQADVARLSEEAGALAEREHLAREIHDTLAQGFTSIITLAQAVESELDSDPSAARRHVAMMRETAQENLGEARALVAGRAPAHLDEDSLEQSLRRIVARLGEELDVDARIRVLGAATPLPPQAQVGLVRAAQEALANIRKHAEATSVQVLLKYSTDELRLTVEDDGRGFVPAAAPNGHGLGNLRHRAEALGGTCLVDSAPGRGTRIHIELPLPGAKEAVP
ncbi:signal transduction histidine kinase [Lipingzhangella halophila]|uniref:Oxygen sensor histidine kinase NreB n=1 Tax=Lipingzhangella halophila TaxID=1783352 RepID=A0A7W7RK09_9ACTN|nr:sensor histidine kinase [Lipingzhangella halophila]MBB4933407.1 signal transduction histidine kinase [Lipingzhangella halophila]